MERSTKQLLIDIASGKLPVEAVHPSYDTPKELKFSYDLCSGVELDRLLKMVRSLGLEIDKWPETEKKYLSWLKEDVAGRLAHGFSDRVRFWCNALPGEMIVIKYKDPSRPPLFQLEHGWNQEAHPNTRFADHNKHFVHFNLSDWRPDIHFAQLSKKELEEKCLELISEKELSNP